MKLEIRGTIRVKIRDDKKCIAYRQITQENLRTRSATLANPLSSSFSPSAWAPCLNTKLIAFEIVVSLDGGGRLLLEEPPPRRLGMVLKKREKTLWELERAMIAVLVVTICIYVVLGR